MALCNVQASPDINALQGKSICHVISGDLWGGAEAQAFGLLKELSKHTQVRAIVFNDGELRTRIAASQIEVDLANEKQLGFFKLLLRVRSILAKWRPDVIHVHGIKENLIAGLSARLLRIPVVRTHHGRGMLGAKKRYNYVERFNASFLTHSMISVSSDLANFLKGSGLTPRNLHIIKNGIQRHSPTNNRASAVTQKPINDHSFTVGTVGRLVGVKNQKCLLDAVKLASSELPSIRLVLVGDGPLAAQLEHYAAESGITDRVQFAGFQQDVEKYMRSFDLFAMSSLHEGVPMSLLEAMSLNIPVVCTNVGGIPEVITHERNGLLVPSNDAKAMAQAITKIANDRIFAEQLTTNARNTITSELSFERCLANTISLYGGMIAQ